MLLCGIFNRFFVSDKKNIPVLYRFFFFSISHGKHQQVPVQILKQFLFWNRFCFSFQEIFKIYIASLQWRLTRLSDETFPSCWQMADRGRSETVWKPAGNVEPVEPSPEAFFWKINFITTHHNRSLSSIDLWRSQGHVAIGRLETDWTFSVNVFSGRFPVSIKPGKDKALEAL